MRAKKWLVCKKLIERGGVTDSTSTGKIQVVRLGSETLASAVALGVLGDVSRTSLRAVSGARGFPVRVHGLLAG